MGKLTLGELKSWLESVRAAGVGGESKSVQCAEALLGLVDAETERQKLRDEVRIERARNITQIRPVDGDHSRMALLSVTKKARPVRFTIPTGPHTPEQAKSLARFISIAADVAAELAKGGE